MSLLVWLRCPLPTPQKRPLVQDWLVGLCNGESENGKTNTGPKGLQKEGGLRKRLNKSGSEKEREWPRLGEGIGRMVDHSRIWDSKN